LQLNGMNYWLTVQVVPFLRNEYQAPYRHWRRSGHRAVAAVIAARQDGRWHRSMFFTTNREGDPALMLLAASRFLITWTSCSAPTSAIRRRCSTLSGMQPPPACWTGGPYKHFHPAGTGGRGGMVGVIQCCSTALFHCQRLGGVPQASIKAASRIRRKMRRLGLILCWYIVENGPAWRRTKAFMDMMAQDLNKRRFLTDDAVQFHQWHIRAGWLQPRFFEIGGEKAASYINFDYLNSIWVYNSAIGFKFTSSRRAQVLLLPAAVPTSTSAEPDFATAAITSGSGSGPPVWTLIRRTRQGAGKYDPRQQ
jgi:hypothetical protein